jgi:DNA polymerase
MFDGAILNWIYGIRPKGWIDTLSMARALHGTEVGGSLKVLAEYYGLGVKGTEVVNALGLKREQFSAEQLALYGEYCKNDVALTWKLFRAMSESFPAVELRLIDLTIKMFTEPVLQLDRLALAEHLARIKLHKLAVLGQFDKDILMSNPKFAEALTELGVTPPMKVSPANGKLTYAFSKTDEEFKALLEHEDVRVQALVAARLGTKSTIEETRTERFIGIADRGPLPVPLRYYAAHTGRWGGDDKLNLQNLPRSSLLKKCIIAPMGYYILDSDSSQIEARTLAWLTGQEDLVSAFENGEDVYRIMASRIYNKPETEITKGERFVGKTTILGCIAEGTLVLCDSGWKPIEQVTTKDQLWDGEGWVCHQGLVTKGYKQTLNVCGSWLTPDHQILCGTQWLEAQLVAQDESTLCRALGTGAENLPLQGTSRGKGMACGLSSFSATAGYPSTRSSNKILKILRKLYIEKEI